MAADGKGPQHKRNSFFGRHKKSPDFRVRDRERKVLTELLLKNGNHTAARTQHIAETHRGAANPIGWPRCNNQFTEPLGGPHDAGWIHRLVARDENPVSRTYFLCHIERREQLETFVFHSLFNVRLHYWPLLVG